MQKPHQVLRPLCALTDTDIFQPGKDNTGVGVTSSGWKISRELGLVYSIHICPTCVPHDICYDYRPDGNRA